MDTLVTDQEAVTYIMKNQILKSYIATAPLPLEAATDVVFGSLCELCVLFYVEARHAQGLVTEDTRAR
jgi:hypothetical protein